jgi:choline dehydrogenase
VRGRLKTEDRKPGANDVPGGSQQRVLVAQQWPAMHDREMPTSADIVIVGGGTAGCALAGILARTGDARILVLEAGPDYGHFANGGWPADLLDARHLPGTRSWNYTGLAHPTQQTEMAFDRARVIGGCSSHNGCVVIAGHRRDYDAWAELGNPGWDWAGVEPAFQCARTAFGVRQIAAAEVAPFHGAFVDACVAAGLARVDKLDNPDGVAEVGFSSVNIRDGMRWNAALAYLDPVRDRPNLQVVGNVLVDRIEISGSRAVAVHVVNQAGAHRVEAGRIALAAGAYGSPAVLLRSGIGPADDLGDLGIEPRHALPGVGRTLQDHSAYTLQLRATPELVDQTRDRDEHGWLPDEQAVAKARSRGCREAFDLHMISYHPRLADGNGWSFQLQVICVDVRSTGSVTLVSADPAAAPRIDHGYLTDPDGHDATVLQDGVELLRQVAGSGPLANLVALDDAELQALPPGSDLRALLGRRVEMYYHPSCTCRMGPASDPLAVVDVHGRVHGVDNLYVCDASIYPRLMRANTNLPSAMLAEQLAPSLAAGR